MKKNNILYLIIKILLNTIYFLSFLLIGIYFIYSLGYIDWLDYDETEFMVNLFSSIAIWGISYLFIYFISIIFHELGHLIFGLRAKLEFLSFSVLNNTFVKENGKVNLKKMPIVPGAKGYCNMAFNENKDYKKNEVISYFFGGIIFNLILVLMFLIVFIFNKNAYINMICLQFICSNLYFALYNSIPNALRTGLNTDMLQIINYLNDDEFTKIYGRLQKIQMLVLTGTEIKNLDKNLFYMPKEFNTRSKILMAQFYIDYMSSIDKYDEAINAIKIVQDNARDILQESETNILKAQLINCIFYGNYELNKIEEIWNDKFEKYLSEMEIIVPEFFGIKYLYYSLIINDNIKAEKCLNKFNKIENSFSNKKAVETTKTLINDVNKRIKKGD